jgi:hypothetical protein
MMKLRAPEGCASVSHCGRVLQVETDGSLEIEDAEIAESLLAHGFSLWPATGPRDVKAMTRSELIERVMEVTLQNLKAMQTETIRAQLVRTENVIPELRDENALGVETAPNADRCREDDIESLNRPALFALLRKKKVRVTLPVTNEQLRAAARAAVQGES